MFIDIHAHAYRHPCPFPNRFCLPGELLERYDRLGIQRGVLLPLVSPEVYLPQSNHDIIEMAEESGGRFVPFCNVDPRALTNSVDAPLGELLRYYRECGCRGIGEFMPNMPFLHPMVQNVFKHAEEVGFPLIFDISDRVGADYGLQDDPGLPQLEATLEKFPDLIILGHGPAFWAELGRLETPADRTRYPAYPIHEEGVVPKLFRRYPNLYGDLSAGSGYNALARDPDYAVKFLTEFQGRLLFGTDICTPQQEAPLVQYLQELKEQNRISEDTFRKVARENAVALLGLD